MACCAGCTCNGESTKATRIVDTWVAIRDELLKRFPEKHYKWWNGSPNLDRVVTDLTVADMTRLRETPSS